MGNYVISIYSRNRDLLLFGILLILTMLAVGVWMNINFNNACKFLSIQRKHNLHFVIWITAFYLRHTDFHVTLHVQYWSYYNVRYHQNISIMLFCGLQKWARENIEKICLSPMTKTLTPTETSKKQRDSAKFHQKLWLRTDWGLSIGVTTATTTGVLEPVHGRQTFPLTATVV